jgi:hypothetical protein
MRFCAVLAVSLANLVPAIAGAADPAPIMGDWCGLDDYVIYVRPGDVSFHPMRGMVSPPAYDVQIADDRATYKQKYDLDGEIVVSCHLDLHDPQTAVETCDGNPDDFYPNSDETAELKRCFANPAPGV